MDVPKTVCKLFDHFYQKIYKNNYKLDLSINNQLKQVNNFVDLLIQQFGLNAVGTNLILDYICFSFHYWHSKNTKRNISLNWIIGKKTFKRWVDRKSGNNYYTQQWLNEMGINLDYLRQEIFEQELQHKGLDPAEEIEKLRFHGDARLAHCIQFTTMYHHKSINCLGCESKSTCKKLLSINRPQLFKARGYAQ